MLFRHSAISRDSSAAHTSLLLRMDVQTALTTQTKITRSCKRCNLTFAKNSPIFLQSCEPDVDIQNVFPHVCHRCYMLQRHLCAKKTGSIQIHLKWNDNTHNTTLNYDSHVRSIAASNVVFITEGNIKNLNPHQRNVAKRWRDTSIQLNKFSFSHGKNSPNTLR